MQIVLKVNHHSNCPKIPYIVDSDYKKRNCYARNLNYLKFENKIIEIVRKVCKIYVNNQTYIILRYTNKEKTPINTDISTFIILHHI